MGEIGELLVIRQIFQSFPPNVRSVGFQTLDHCIVRRQAETIDNTRLIWISNAPINQSTILIMPPQA